MPVHLSDCTLILLAGERSRRMGRDKARLPVGNTTLLDHLSHSLRAHVAEILVSIGHHTRNFDGYQCVPDLFPGKGPLVGMGSTLAVTGTKWNVIVPCDMPDVSAALLHRLADGVGPATAVVPLLEGEGISPLPGLYHRSLHGLMLQAAGAGMLSIRTFLTRIPLTVVPIGDDLMPSNLNTWMDYVRFLDRNRSGSTNPLSDSEPSRLPRMKRRMADRAGLETVQPPDSGKEFVVCPDLLISPE